MAKQKLGDILVQSGVLTAEQLARAVRLQSQTGCLLGEAVIRLGFAAEEEIAMALSRQLGIAYASQQNQILKPEKSQNLDKVILEKFARENCVLPLFLENKVLAVAMPDPTNVMLLDNLKLMSGFEIQPFISTRAQILKMIDELYSGGTDSLIDRAMEKPAAKGKSGDADLEVDSTEEKVDLDRMLAQAQGAQAVGLVNAIVKQALGERASDIHLENYDERVSLRFRIDGVLYERSTPPKEVVAPIISRVKILSKLDIAERRLPQDGNFAVKLQNRTIEIRVSTLPTVFGEKLVLRLLDKGSVELNIEKLGFEPQQRDSFLAAAQYPHGLLFLTGPTGSGKTTTLYAVLNTIKTPEKNFLTVEDPVEMKLSGVNQVQVKPQIGLTFASAIRAFLRQDPDVILVGETRDPETAQTCLRAALTGHLVLSTLHTNDALGAVLRLKDLGVESFLLSSSLALVAAQRLVRVLCEHCREPYRPDSKILATCLKESCLPNPPPPDTVTFYRAKGCERCARTGYMGRKAIFEVYLINEEMRDIIYRSADTARLKEMTLKAGMWNMRASGWRKVLAGVTTSDELLSVTLGD